MFEQFPLLIAIVALVRTWSVPKRLTTLQDELTRHQEAQHQLAREVQQLREQLHRLQAAADESPASAAPSAPAIVATLPPPVVPTRLAAAPPLAAPVEQRLPTPVPRPSAPLAALEPLPLIAPAPVRPPEPAEPSWWERASAMLLEHWTGILGAVVLVTGVGFLGIYTALQLAPPYRFLLICLFAAGLLGAQYALRHKDFASQLNAWLQSSAAAIFLFACVGAVSIPGLRWVGPPLDYGLLLLGVSANLYLAWRTSRQEVATLHGVLSLVALAVLSPTALTLGAAAGVTVFSIAITYRQHWRYQLLLSIASFFVFHLYWHQQLRVRLGSLRLSAIVLVLAVGAAAAGVQYRRVYARRRFEPLLFAAHVLNWTSLGINLYLHSTGSVWKTIPLALAAGLTYWTGQQAKRLGIGWLFQTDTILSLLLGLATALSLRGWHATPSVVALFMLLEALLIALVMARQSEALVYRVAMGGAGLAGLGLLLTVAPHIDLGPPATLYREAVLLALGGWAGLAFVQLLGEQPLLALRPVASPDQPTGSVFSDRQLLEGFAGMAGALQAGAGLLLARVLFGWRGMPVAGLLLALLALAMGALGLAAWLHRAGTAPAWVRRQQLVLGQGLVLLALTGLHELGLSWPGVQLVLYAENLLVALLLSGRHENGLLRAQTYLLVLLAAGLPLLLGLSSPLAVGPETRAALLLAAALLTVAYQLWPRYWPRAQPELACLPLTPTLVVPLLGAGAGWLLLGAGALVYEHSWAGWAALGLLGSGLVLRQRMAVPGLWAGLALAAVGYLILQWSYALNHVHYEGVGDQLRTYRLGLGATLLYLLPTAGVPGLGLLTYWWPAAGRYVRWPWLYLLGAHLTVAVAATATLTAYYQLGVLALAVAAFAGAQWWRRALPDAAAVAHAGQPDRYLLHLAYGLLAGSLLLHVAVLSRYEFFFTQPAEYCTAAALFAVLAGLALAVPPASAPQYRSWCWLHRWLPEAALLFGLASLADFVRWSWQPLIWVSVALLLSHFGPQLPLRFRRLAVYGRLYYWLAAATACGVCLSLVTPAYLLAPGWWALATAVALLFAYVGLALRQGAAALKGLSPAWDLLACPPRRRLEAALLYPAFAALSLLLVQSFGRSVLTVLLMLEVVAIFSTSLLLRRQDLRYVALGGMLGCLLRLVFFDLSQSNTITRAIVFIFMGLLMLGMNALYARFKARFELPAADVPIPDLAEPPPLG